MKYNPQGNLIIVKIDEDETKVGSLYVPEPGSNKPMQTGVVTAAGPGGVNYGVFFKNSIRVGDHILFPRNSTLLELDKKERLSVIRENDVLCTIDA